MVGGSQVFSWFYAIVKSTMSSTDEADRRQGYLKRSFTESQKKNNVVLSIVPLKAFRKINWLSNRMWNILYTFHLLAEACK